MDRKWWLVIAGFLYDVTKSYMMAFAIFAAVSLLATVFMFFARPPQANSQDKEAKPTYKFGKTI
jgi:cyanate permease